MVAKFLKITKRLIEAKEQIKTNPAQGSYDSLAKENIELTYYFRRVF